MSPLSCSATSVDADEPLAGSAPAAEAWVIVEQHGAYGTKALTESGLPPAIGAELGTWAEHGVKVLLARPTGRHSQQHGERRVWIAHARSSAGVSTVVDDLADLVRLDPRALAAGALPDWPAITEPTLFLCTNGRRDQCCAIRGRAVLDGCRDRAVWECSHLGGHRFAATGVLLPWSYVVGRVESPGQLADLMAAARRGDVLPHTMRGRSHLTPAEQAAEIAVREHADMGRVGDITGVHTVAPARRTGSDGADIVVRVELRAGPRWLVTLRPRAIPTRAESCGAEPVTGSAPAVITIEATEAGI